MLGRRFVYAGAAWRFGTRGKFDITRVPPWKRWPRNALLRTPLSKFPEVEPLVDISLCTDPAVLADVVCEVVPWKRRWEHHAWLHLVCKRAQYLLPDTSPRDVVRVILAFGELYTKRKTHTLLFHDYETYTQLFQALPVGAATAKTLLPLLRAYRRMGVAHEAFVRAACDQVAAGTIELEIDQLTELVKLLADERIMSPRLFEFAAEVLDLKFAYFSEDNVGDITRAFCALRYRSQLFFSTLKRELPFRLHEYAWWNLIDIADLYLTFQVDDRDMVQRIGNEAFKLVFSMKDQYPAKALKVLAFLEAADKRTFRLLIRNQLRCIKSLDPVLTADTIMACVALQVAPDTVYHRLWGGTLYHMFTVNLLKGLGSLSAKKTCDVVAALASAGQIEHDLMHVVAGIVVARPYKFHAEHLISLLRDFATCRHKETDMRALLLDRHDQLPECTPSALCSLPDALFGHQARSFSVAGGDSTTSGGLGHGSENSHRDDAEILAEASRLLCAPGAYRLPLDPRALRSKDDFWWQQLRQRHFRLRRRAAAAGVAVEPPVGITRDPLDIGDSISSSGSSAALAHVSRQECLQLVDGCARLRWYDESLLHGIASWLCEGRRHAELTPGEVACFLEAFCILGYAQPLLRVSLEHALLRVAPTMDPMHWTRALRGALEVGMCVRSAAMRALVQRCTSGLAFVPPEDRDAFNVVSASILQASEREILSTFSVHKSSWTRLPIEIQMLRRAM